METDIRRADGRLRRPWTGLRRAGPLVAVALGITLVVAACGGSSGPGVASIGSSSPTSATSSGGSGSGSPLAYAQCMRSHGIKDFPDPDADGGFDMGGNANSDLNPNSAQFQAADQACKSLRGQGHTISPAQQQAMQANALKFSQCMRSHGIKDFPDPVFTSGGVSMRINAHQSSDLNPSNPQFQAAQKACQGIMGKPKGGGTTTQSGSGSKTGGGGQ